MLIITGWQSDENLTEPGKLDTSEGDSIFPGSI